MALLGLGRREAADERDKGFKMTAILPAKASTRKFRYWNEGKIKINQGAVPACVGAAWVHFLINGPVTHPAGKLPNFIDIYKRAQKVDEWAGENYAGTSVRAGAKVLQALGFIESYLWAWTAEELAEAVLTRGPVVSGTNWYRGMSYPDAKGIIKPTGPIDGGHAYLINGYNRTRGIFRMQQSWYPSWGDSGNAWIEGEDMEKLIYQAGEVCIATEKKP